MGLILFRAIPLLIIGLVLICVYFAVKSLVETKMAADSYGEEEAQTKRAEKEASPYVECRSWHGLAIHIRDRREESGQALCGYDPLDDRSPLTPESFKQTLRNEHANMFYCRDCRSGYETILFNEGQA